MFAHLHTYTEYSVLDGINRIPDLVQQTKQLGMNALAITDQGSLNGVVDFYSECKESGIKPIIGCEVYAARGSRLNKDRADRSPIRLVLLARETKATGTSSPWAPRLTPRGSTTAPGWTRRSCGNTAGGWSVSPGAPRARYRTSYWTGKCV